MIPETFAIYRKNLEIIVGRKSHTNSSNLIHSAWDWYLVFRTSLSISLSIGSSSQWALVVCCWCWWISMYKCPASPPLRTNKQFAMQFSIVCTWRVFSFQLHSVGFWTKNECKRNGLQMIRLAQFRHTKTYKSSCTVAHCSEDGCTINENVPNIRTKTDWRLMDVPFKCDWIESLYTFVWIVNTDYRTYCHHNASQSQLLQNFGQLTFETETAFNTHFMNVWMSHCVFNRHIFYSSHSNVYVYRR